MENLQDSDAIITYRKALVLRPPGHINRGVTLNNLANALRTRFLQLGKIEDLEEAILFYREALNLHPLGHPDHFSSLNNLANALHTCFSQLRRIKDLEDSILCYRGVLDFCPPDHPNRSGSLYNFANALYTRFLQLGKMKDLEDAISSHQEALSLLPPGHPHYSNYLHNLGKAFGTRFEQLGRMADLEDAISFQREALNLRPLGHYNRSSSLTSLAIVLETRFRHLGVIEDLENAISFHREALSLRPPGNPNRPNSLNNLAMALDTRFKKLGKIEDLQDAISSHREGLTLLPSGHPDRSSSLNNLAIALQTCFHQLGRMEDLEDAISSHYESLALLPPGHPLCSRYLSNLGCALSTRFEQLSRMEDLEDGISFYREALALCPPGHVDRSSCLNNIATALNDRYIQLDRIEDLEDGISFYREALGLHPPGHLLRSISFNDLGNALRIRFERLGKIEDLEDAILFHHEALTLRPPGHPARYSSLNNLAIALCTRFNQSGRIEDLEDGISLHREALPLLPPGHPARSDFLTDLGDALRARFDRVGKIEDLEAAISSYHERLTLCPPGHPHHSGSLNNLAIALDTRYMQLGVKGDLENSFDLREQAANDLTSSLQHRLSAAVNWITYARHHRHKSTLAAYSVTLRILRRCLILRPNVNLQQKFLATAHIPRSLASDAASAAIDAGELETAVELLEEGRAILWSRMGGYRYPLDQLRQANKQLADRLETLSSELERLELSSGSRPLASEGPTALAVLEAQMARHRRLSEEWEEIVGRVRKIEGFTNFLQTVPFLTLQTAAAEGPIVLINISKYRSDAIILHADNPSPILVPLPDAQPQDLIQLTEKLALARDGATENPSKQFLPILRDLWDNIISPVHDCLTELGIPKKSRVWWCPTSELCALPLHAAGPYHPKQQNLPDLYISSYIPTISSLIRAKSNMLCDSVNPKLLVIGQPETLPKVQDEIDHIQQLGDFVDAMVGAEATRDKALHGLQQHSWAHFACHGHLGDNGQPFHASFELHSGSRLTLLDLIQARLPNAELAFLSACHSAAGDLITPDETIHLAAALQFCGFKSVVGTLWEMGDEDGPTFSKEFYKHMFREPGNKANFRDSAEAVNLAIREMRRNRVPLHRWIMFVHIGA